MGDANEDLSAGAGLPNDECGNPVYILVVWLAVLCLFIATWVGIYFMVF